MRDKATAMSTHSCMSRSRAQPVFPRAWRQGSRTWMENSTTTRGPRSGSSDRVAVDPTFGQFPADASHLRFTIGGLGKQAELLRLMGTLKIDVMSAR